MLSGETSVGKYPVETVADHGAASSPPPKKTSCQASHNLDRVPETRTRAAPIARAAAEVGDHLGAKALVAFTIAARPPAASPATARRSRSWPSPRPATRAQLTLTWGVETFLVPLVDPTDDMVGQVESRAPGLPAGEGRQGRHRRRKPAWHPAPPTRCACTVWVTPSQTDDDPFLPWPFPGGVTTPHPARGNRHIPPRGSPLRASLVPFPRHNPVERHVPRQQPPRARRISGNKPVPHPLRTRGSSTVLVEQPARVERRGQLAPPPNRGCKSAATRRSSP